MLGFPYAHPVFLERFFCNAVSASLPEVLRGQGEGVRGGWRRTGLSACFAVVLLFMAAA